MKNLLSKSKRKDMTVDEALQSNLNPHAEDMHDFFKRNAAVLGIIVMAVALILSVGIYTGYVTYHAGQAGYIYYMNIQFKQPQYNWAGLYGASFGVGVSQPWEYDIEPGSMNEENVFFECFEVGIDHEIYASTVPLDQLDLNSLQPGTPAELDAFIGIDASDYDSATNTFTSTITVNFGSTQINNVPAMFTYVGNNTNNQTFDTGILKDGNGNLILVSHVYENLTRGFNGRFYNYQTLLPIPSNSSQSFYLFSDPNDICLGGSASPQILGIVEGTVTDSSGNPLEDVIIVVGGDSTVTNAAGVYNMTAEAGNQTIFAIKENYKVYQNEIEVIANNITVHNIVLELDSVPNQFTDIGPSFESGVDEEGTDVGPGEVPYRIEQPEVIEGEDFVIPISRIYRRLREGEFAQEMVVIRSYKSSSTQINLQMEGEVAKLTQIDANSIIIPSRGDGQFTLTFFANTTPGIYNGSVNLTGGIDVLIPVTIEIVDKDKLPVQTLLMDLSAPDKTLYAGSTFTFRTDLTNLLTDQEYPITIFYTIQSMDGTQTIWTHSTNVFLKTSVSILKNVELPPDMKIGDYVLRATADYLDLSSSSSYVFTVELPFYQAIVFGKLRVWHLFLILLGIGLITLAAILIKRNIEAKKKYHLKVEPNEMPKEGPRSIKIGKIAETQLKAYMNLENFKTHTIVAGSTGGGKSFSAQVIIEAMLDKDVAVIVFDPTAQWTGMLRKLQNKGLLALYPNFDMKPNDAKAFKGNIRQITNARELIDIRKYMKPGEIQVFAVHKLDPKDIDVFVANTVREVFHENFDESEPLRLMLVYDEVHRLLPKFGGSGEGFLQIERACREFRKWGIGVMLISQVLADFVGQIKANINTEVQMRTRDEGDLDRIKTKYGEEVLRSLVKASVGTGMVQNAAYNRGRPYFVTFRPIMHSVARLSDEEIVQYNTYNEKIDQLTYELDQLEELKQDVFDLKLELKLALDKVKAGNFNMAQIYLEGLEPRIKKFWDKLGKQPKKLEIRMVSEAELKAEMEKAKAGRQQFDTANKKSGEGGEEKKLTPEEKFKQDVKPDKILHLHNDMLVVNPKSLYSEIEAMKDSDFQFHVTDTKNDFADWIRNAVEDNELADLLAQETDKQAIMKLLDLREKGQKLPKLEIKKQSPQKEEPKTETKAEAKPEQASNPEEAKKAFDELSADPDKEKSVAVAEEMMKPVEEQKEENKEEQKVEAKLEEKKAEPQQKKSEVLQKEAPEGQYFNLENGQALKSLKDLKDYIPNMPEDIFSKHVNNEKNDFANWVRNVFKEDQLADKLSNAHTKDSIEEVLSSV